MNTGRRAEAEREYDAALLVFPEYHLALAAKARARAADGELLKAVEYYERALQRVPLPETAAALGDLYAKLGRTEETSRIAGGVLRDRKIVFLHIAILCGTSQQNHLRIQNVFKHAFEQL